MSMPETMHKILNHLTKKVVTYKEVPCIIEALKCGSDAEKYNYLMCQYLRHETSVDVEDGFNALREDLTIAKQSKTEIKA